MENNENQANFQHKIKEEIDLRLTNIYVREVLERNRNLWNESNTLVFDTKLSEWESEIKGKLTSLRGSSEKPHVTIVIPAYNEERKILQVLDGIANQQHNNSIEVIVVDNNSSPDGRTGTIAEQSGARVVKYNLEDDNPNKKLAQIAYARQRGLEEARGNIVISTDADAIAASPNWIAKLTEPLDRDQNITCVTGQVEHYDRQGASYIYLYDGYGRVNRRLANATHTSVEMITLGPNMAFRKLDALEVGGYDLKSYPGEDWKMGENLRKLGKVIFVSDNDALIVHSSRRLRHEGLQQVLLRQVSRRNRLYSQQNGIPKNYR